METFWGSTLLELYDIIESRHRMMRQEEKVHVGQVFVLAEAISSRISYLFTDPKERSDDMILQAWDAYPDLFKEEKEAVEMKKEEIQLAEQRAKVIEWAETINAQRHRKAEK